MNAGAADRLEAGQLNIDPVLAWRQARRRVDTFSARDDDALPVRGDVGNGDGGAGNRGRRLIPDKTGNFTGGDLSLGGPRIERNARHEEHKQRYGTTTDDAHSTSGRPVSNDCTSDVNDIQTNPNRLESLTTVWRRRPSTDIVSSSAHRGGPFLEFDSYGLRIVLDAYARRCSGAAFFAIAPFAGAVAAVPLLHEHFTLQDYGAGGLMAIGIALVVRGWR